VCGPDGVAIFDALHRRGTVSEAMLYAFDLLELDGEDLRALPLGDRRKRLTRLVGKRRLGIVLSAHTDEDGAAIFEQACKMGLEGIVSKRLSAPYRSGPVKGLDQGEEPEQRGDDPGARRRLANVRRGCTDFSAGSFKIARLASSRSPRRQTSLYGS
jgi:hypothetical protein